MGSALLDDAATATLEVAEAPRQTEELSRRPSAERAASALRRQAAERVAAHRSRRIGVGSLSATAISPAPRNARSAKIAAAVAERYAQTQTYNDFLAAEADRVVQQACAAAEVAAVNAQALAAAQQRLLDAMEQQQNEIAQELRARAQTAESLPQIEHEASAARLLWGEMETDAQRNPADPVANRRAFRPPQTRAKQARRSGAAEPLAADEPFETAVTPGSAQALADGITIRLYQDESGATRVALDPPAARSASLPAAAHLAATIQSDEEAQLLDEEIAFRHEPVFEEPAGPAEPLPANLIEFPRQLVAARKARPRLAEGPMRAEAEEAPGAGQLRIFEVEPEQIAVAPRDVDAEVEATHTAQWSSILLESRPRAEALGFATSENEAHGPVKPRARASQSLQDVASIGRRTAAMAINGAIVATAFAAFAVVFLWIVEHTALTGAGTFARAAGLFAGRQAIESAVPFAACAFGLLAAMYQALFFTFSTATPGMRVARIALCTFTDENPTRGAVRRRLPALLLSALPLGFGFVWAALDEERLTWHDRICGIYHRSY
ncbi:MAG TPA: RDD family protein [Acidobacteriaceae bacterium]